MFCAQKSLKICSCVQSYLFIGMLWPLWCKLLMTLLRPAFCLQV